MSRLNHRDHGLFTITDVARLLNTTSPSIQHHFKAGRIPKPTTVLRKRSYYTLQEVEVIRQFWNNRVPMWSSQFTAVEVAQMKAMYSAGLRQRDIADHFGVVQASVSDYLIGAVPPGRRGGPAGVVGVRQGVRPKRRRNVAA